VIGLLLRLYPPAWRERYGEELKSLLADTGVGPRTLADVVLAAARERRRSLVGAIAGGVTMTIGPAWRHPTGWALAAFAVLAPTAAFVTGSLLAYELGIGPVMPAMDSFSAWLGSQPPVVDLLLVVAPALALAVALAPVLRLHLPTDRSELTVGVRLRWVNLVAAVIALVVGGLLVWHIVAEAVLEAGT
jgi:hypothetical protein